MIDPTPEERFIAAVLTAPTTLKIEIVALLAEQAALQLRGEGLSPEGTDRLRHLLDQMLSEGE